MTAFLAIVGDTWRQSKHQWVMVLVLLCLCFAMYLAVIQPELRVAPDGETIITTDTDRERVRFGMELQWEGLYASALRHELGYEDKLAEQRREVSDMLDRLNDLSFEFERLKSDSAPEDDIRAAADAVRNLQFDIDNKQKLNREQESWVRGEVNRKIEERAGHLSKLEKGSEWHLASIANFIFIIAMLGFIAVSAGFIPNMLEAGNVDLVLSKPIRRWQLFFGKYLGGMILFSLALIVVYVAIFLGYGLKTGVWMWRFFGALPMTIFSVALLYSIVGWVGLLTRSTSMAIVIGYVYYVVVDTALALITDPADAPFISRVDWVKDMVEIIKVTFPSFHWLAKSAESAVFSVVVVPWTQVGVGAAWLVIALGTAYNRFRINDY